MGRLADELVRLGYISSSPDPVDRRAVSLAFTDIGLDLMRQSFAVMSDIERRCARRIGKDAYQVLLHSLSEIAVELEAAQT
jgi:DNA-binding MarR family transcriptional regulator